MEAPFLILVFLLFSGSVSCQRSRNRMLREKLDTLANQTQKIHESSDLIVKPLTNSTTVPPTPVTEGMDYEGSGYLDVFWKLTARAITPTSAPSNSNFHDLTTPRPASSTVISRDTSSVTEESTTSSVTKAISSSTVPTILIQSTASTIKTTSQPQVITLSPTIPEVTTTATFTTITAERSKTPTTARIAQTTFVPTPVIVNISSTPSYSYTNSIDISNVTLVRNETIVILNPDGKKQVERFINTVAFTTLQFLFGDDNDTFDDSDNETGRIGYSPTLYAGGNIDWQGRIRAWFESEFLGKLKYFYCLELSLALKMSCI
jgi:hypothetical protein